MCLRHVVLLPQAAYVWLPSVYPEQRRVSPPESPLAEVFILNSLNPFKMNTCHGDPRFAQFLCNVRPFRITTFNSGSKQMTLPPFRLNTYHKPHRPSPPPCLHCSHSSPQPRYPFPL